jgi:2,3-bisphosphoglycerate-independent phosphoglycerate mutase
MTSTVEREGSTSHVPFGVWGPGVTAVRNTRFNEAEAARGDLHVEAGHTLLAHVLEGRSPQRVTPQRPAETAG